MLHLSSPGKRASREEGIHLSASNYNHSFCSILYRKSIRRSIDLQISTTIFRRAATTLMY
jgi:hypothetical protein